MEKSGFDLIKVVYSPFNTEGYAYSGVKQIYADNHPEAYVSDAARYAAYIQEARDNKDYERADIYRKIVIDFGMFVECGKDFTKVSEGPFLRVAQEMRNDKKKVLNSKKTKKIHKVEKL